MASRGGPKSSRALFRDCLRLIKHMAGLSSPKAASLRGIVAAQFRANAHVTDPAKLHSLKQGCVLLVGSRSARAAATRAAPGLPRAPASLALGRRPIANKLFASPRHAPAEPDPPIALTTAPFFSTRAHFAYHAISLRHYRP
jgi:hypothetical protein